jgi:plastocyanin
MATTTTMETGTTVTPGATTTTLAAGTTETPPGPPTAVVADEVVSITDSGFVPNTITVPVGTTVGWTNDATANHTVSATGAAGFFDSGLLQPGESYSYTFNGAGNYTYQSLTTGIAGEVIVTA